MRGKNGSRPRGPSIGGESSMTTLFNDDPLIHGGLALFGNGGLLSHTPPSFTPGSYEVSHMKRARAGSISGRLRSASDLEEKGLIDKSQKGVLKDLIISGDSELQAALDLYDDGDASQLEALMENGLLDRRESFDLLDNLDFGIMELGMSDEEPTENVTVEPVPIPEGNVSGGAQSTNTLSPPPLPTTASSATTVDVIASGEGAGVSVLRNSVNGEAVEVAPVSSVGGVEKVSTQGVGSDGVQGRVEAVGGANGGGGDGSGRDSGRSGQDGDQDINLAGEGSGHFDIGEMAFDATFDHDYGGHEDDVDMKDGDEQMDSSSPASAAAAAVSTAVGPLRVVGSTSQDKLAPPNLISSRGSHHRDETGSDADDQRPDVDADDDDDEDDGTDTDDSRDDGGGGGGVVMSDDECGGKEGHGDVEAPGLGSFSTMGAVIGDFSPQFKFSFTDEIHLDLGGGLKDELRDLESFSEHGPDPHGRGGEGYLMGISASRAQQLLSRGGPAVVRSEMSEMLSSSPSRLGSTRSSTAAAAAAASAKAEAAAGSDDGEPAAVVDGSGFTTNHYASGAAYHGRHTGPYATAAAAAAGGREEGATGGGVGALLSAQARPQGSSAAAAAAGVAGQDAHHTAHAAAAAAAAAGATQTHHHAARGRPVVSGMGIMVGGGPRLGMAAGADGEERKFVGAYSPEARRQRIERFLEKREKRVWTKMVKYDVRKNFADTRMRVKGRFVKKEDEALLREVMACA
ncbi:unnamed protein product [Pylaiella littoralis]